MPVLYKCAIECAVKRWPRLAVAEAAFRGFWEDYLGFQVGEAR